MDEKFTLFDGDAKEAKTLDPFKALGREMLRMKRKRS